jgi:dTDP-L-rhamnose 4-epimerase
MMTSRVLITGGAGFIGSHLADELLAQGYAVRVLDNMNQQVHGPSGERAVHLDGRVDLVIGDVRDARAVRSALSGVDAVVHLAAAVGVGQSMYQIAEYTGVNNLGTAVLLEQLAKQPLKRLVVASSMSIYGEGLYRASDGTLHDAVERSHADLAAGRFEPRSRAGQELEPAPTPESKPPSLASVYALSKYDQERLCLMLGAVYGIPTVALRFFNTYGPRQALSNPYTGVLAIFASRLLNGKPPLIFEDGRQRRDFVSVHDVARACRLALTSEAAVGHAINVGSGRSVSVLEVAELLASTLGVRGVKPEISSRYRVGDVRHCFADISLAAELLGYQPEVDLDRGLSELGAWLSGQRPVDRVDMAHRELESRGLTI